MLKPKLYSSIKEHIVVKLLNSPLKLVFCLKSNCVLFADKFLVNTLKNCVIYQLNTLVFSTRGQEVSVGCIRTRYFQKNLLNTSEFKP